jgi:excinuclease ABC subunit C
MNHRLSLTGPSDSPYGLEHGNHAHKQRRDKARKTSTLEDVPGIGANRRRELLRHFGGLQEVQNASINDLARVNGISQRLAEEIYAFFHND